MNKETLRMQMLAGIITEGQYKEMANEMATLIKKNSPLGNEKPLQTGDLIMWNELDYTNDRGMGPSVKGKIVGKVVKVLGSANIQAEDIKTGDLYKVSRKELSILPNEGDKIEATLLYNYGAGSGSQGSNYISGTVTKINPSSMELSIEPENSNKPLTINLNKISRIKIF